MNDLVFFFFVFRPSEPPILEFSMPRSESSLWPFEVSLSSSTQTPNFRWPNFEWANWIFYLFKLTGCIKLDDANGVKWFDWFWLALTRKRNNFKQKYRTKVSRIFINKNMFLKANKVDNIKFKLQKESNA